MLSSCIEHNTQGTVRNATKQTEGSVTGQHLLRQLGNLGLQILVLLLELISLPLHVLNLAAGGSAKELLDEAAQTTHGEQDQGLS